MHEIEEVPSEQNATLNQSISTPSPTKTFGGVGEQTEKKYR